MSFPATKPFWQHSELVGSGTDIYGICFATLFKKALEENTCYWTGSRTGALSQLVPEQLVEKLLSASCSRILSYSPKLVSTGDKPYEVSWFLVAKDYFCSIKTFDDTLEVWWWSTNQISYEETDKIISRYIVRPERKGKTYVLTADSMGGVKFSLLGLSGEDLIEDNYSPQVVADLHHVAKDLGKKDPCGRVVILDGEPGTGKTHAIRGLLNQVPNATFVLVPVSMLNQLESPSILPTFLRYKESGRPIILILEDADDALVQRKDGNLSQISALLNLSDGILGSQLDLRLLATTNRDATEFDQAAVRPGRLCRRIEIGRLDAEQANRVFARLGGTGTPFKGWSSLAEVYRAFRDQKDGREEGNGGDRGKKALPKGRSIGFTSVGIKAKKG